MLRERIGELEPWPLRGRARPLRAARGRAAAPGADRRRRRGERLHGGRGPAPPRDRLRLRRPGPAARRPARGRARRRRCCRPMPAAVRRVLEVCAAEGIAVVPFGGGTSVVGGVEPLRGPHGRLISLDLARLREVEVDHRSLTARLGAGLRGPEAEAALGAAGRRPRPLPAVLRVRDDRRLRRDPLRRPGLERLRPLRRPGQLGAPDRPGRRAAARWRPRTRPPGRRCASSSSARRASSA